MVVNLPALFHFALGGRYNGGMEGKGEKQILKYGLLHALAAGGYIVLVVLFNLQIGERFGSKPDNHLLAPTLFLLVFVVSAATMGLLVFGRPVVWFMADARREAVWLAVATVAWLAILALLVFAGLWLGWPSLGV